LLDGSEAVGLTEDQVVLANDNVNRPGKGRSSGDDGSEREDLADAVGLLLAVERVEEVGVEVGVTVEGEGV